MKIASICFCNLLRKSGSWVSHFFRAWPGGPTLPNTRADCCMPQPHPRTKNETGLKPILSIIKFKNRIPPLCQRVARSLCRATLHTSTNFGSPDLLSSGSEIASHTHSSLGPHSGVSATLHSMSESLQQPRGNPEWMVVELVTTNLDLSTADFSVKS